MKTMKITMTMLGTLMMLCLLTFSARAGIVLKDNFESYTIGPLVTNNFTLSPWVGNTGTPAANPTNGIQVVADPTGNSANALQVAQYLTQDIFALATNAAYGDVITTNGAGTTTNVFYGFSPSNTVNALYASMTIYVQTIPSATSGNQTYFTHFYSISSGFRARIFLITNNAAPGMFRIAVQNGGTGITNVIPVDFSPGTAYTLVSRYILGSSSSTIWVNPANESSTTNATALDTQPTATINGYAFRQNTSEGVVDVDNLLVGTTFADVVPGSLNAPVIIIQPQDVTVFAGSSATFSNLALGDPILGYQWFSVTNNVTNSIFGATSNILTLTSLTTNQTGSIFCVITNGAGTNTTRLAALNVSASPIPPTIDTNITPAFSTNNVGDTVTFTVAAHGLPAPAFQWKVVPNTNTLVTNIVTGATSPTLTLANITTNQAGLYFVTITNSIGYLSTNSASARLTVVPPPFVNIATLRGMVDSTNFAPTNTTLIYTIQGTVTTWTNMTTSSSSSEFYIQDNSGGIAVFWSGAAASNSVPPAGAIVQVTGPLNSFSGLLEIEPVFTNTLESVTILSTNNPLPAPQPLVFDPNITGAPATTKNATMNALEGMYFVASNVTLNASTSAFVSGANDTITNNVPQFLAATNTALTVNFTNGAGQTFILFINGGTDIPNKPKSTGPVTIFGVLGYFTAAGFEFTPSRFADIISYQHVTNILTHARKGDLATNSYTELVLRPGEVLTSQVSIGDAAGGSVTLSPDTSDLPASAGWSGITSGLTATGVFSFAPTQNDAGSNYLVNLAVSSTAGTAYTNTLSVYVPTTNEQQIAISEFLANPTTNPAAAFFNPLARAAAVSGISTNDQYVEIANQSVADLSGFSDGTFTLDTGVASQPVFRSLDGFGASLLSSNSLVIYGGNGNPSDVPGLATPVAVSRGLFLPKNASGTLVLRNASSNIIDRVVYSASDLSTNGSLSRFPTINSAFVPQPYISTNLTTPGSQYDGGPWSGPTKVPAAVSNIVVNVLHNQVFLTFTANTTLASTLWSVDDLTQPFTVVYGQQFTGNPATFVQTNLPSKRFYFITTQ